MILKVITHGHVESHSVPFGTPLTGMAIESVTLSASDLSDVPDPHTMTWTNKYGAYVEDLLSRIKNSRYAKHRKPHVPANREALTPAVEPLRLKEPVSLQLAGITLDDPTTVIFREHSSTQAPGSS